MGGATAYTLWLKVRVEETDADGNPGQAQHLLRWCRATKRPCRKVRDRLNNLLDSWAVYFRYGMC
jgi:hypothetical protein